ncbi:MAG TPA: MBL fold metallo-hydrolase [Rhizomicrobium sp.]
MWKSLETTLAAVFVLAALPAPAGADIAPGSMNVVWNEGAQDCKAHPQPPLQIHAYNSRTFILRENLCSTFEAPFMYLLTGSDRALLIDTGDVADPKAMPLAKTVERLLPPGLPLLVVHSHRHMDHRAGDRQFAGLSNVRVIGYDIESVRRFYGFAHWPDGIGTIDLGDRIVDVLPTPGHNETHVVFYDRSTALLLSGDFMLPARLLVDDDQAEIASAKRVADFVRNRPVSFVLGAHIEEDVRGQFFPWESQYHPRERVLQMTKRDLLALPAAAAQFDGFYSNAGQFTFMNSTHNLLALGSAVIAAAVALIGLAVWFVRRRRSKRAILRS